MARRKRRTRYKTAPPHVLLIAFTLLFLVFSSLLCSYFPAPILSEDTTVHFLDVGQSDCTLFLSGGEAVLIDAGTADMGQRIVSYLASQGVTELRAVIATHPHADHIGSISTVLASFGVDAFYTTDAVYTTWTYENMLRMVEAQGIPITVPKPGDTLELQSGAVFRFLSPQPDAQYENINNASLVCMFEAGDSRVLMMGDAEKEIEQELLDSDTDLRCDVIKLGHHGSASSSTLKFLQATHARTAILSYGADNSYGHPHEETLKNLNAAVIRDVRSTAEEGTIVINFPKNIAEENAA
ncbi:MAG: MBL fold metallo-hydrolase [Butyricicoccus sp.]|nr:MBL fold metallo-hydrolase [Butyricicoccus sp.]